MSTTKSLNKDGPSVDSKQSSYFDSNQPSLSDTYFDSNQPISFLQSSMALPVRLSRLRLKKCERLPESTEGVVDGETLNLVIDKYHKSGISDRIYHKDFVEGNSRHNIDSLVDRSDLSLSLEHSTYIVDYLL